MNKVTEVFTHLPEYLAYTRKAVINIAGLIASLLALGLLPDKYSAWGATALAVLTAVIHFLTPNADAPAVADPAATSEIPHTQ